MTTLFTEYPTSALEVAEAQRLGDALYGEKKRRSKLGQYATPIEVARLMAGLFEFSSNEATRLLDPGMGAGILSLATIEKFNQARNYGSQIGVTGFEIELPAYLAAKENFLKASSEGCTLDLNLKPEDFLCEEAPDKGFTHSIINPPYKKLSAGDHRQKDLREQGIHAVNLYVAFVWKALLELEEGGQLVAIIPRSFANGTYYRPFRKFLRDNVIIKQVLLVDQRASVFSADNVLQENVIVSLLRHSSPTSISARTKLTWIDGNDLSPQFERSIIAQDIWWDSKETCVLRLPKEADAGSFPNYSLNDLHLKVSTGPVVDFRLQAYLLPAKNAKAYPLLRPRHFAQGRCKWPQAYGKRAGGIEKCEETEKFFWPVGYYVVVRRISSKEEPRRVVASVVCPSDFSTSFVCFENHLNVFHADRKGFSENLAYGLCNYLNSEITDRFLRSISGHTQVNAGDLRLLPYPSEAELLAYAKT